MHVRQSAHPFLLPILLCLALSRPLAAQDAKPLPDPPRVDAPLLSALQRGGHVIYVRHGATDVGTGSASADDLGRCETQRNLSEAGREEARAIGAAFRALRIPVGRVVASPFCRTKDTARLAFDRFELSDLLYFAIDVKPERRAQLAAALRAMLAMQPADGTNTVLVAHSANLKEATGYWPKPEGVAYVFRPVQDGFKALARMEAGDWTALARAASPP